MSDDRTVHAQCGNEQVVRADRAGKWFLVNGGNGIQVKIGQAVEVAYNMQSEGGEIFYDRPGGAIFSARLRSLNGLGPGE